MPPKTIFSSHRTQELYEILNSLKEEEEPVARAEEKQVEKKIIDQPKKQKVMKKKKKKMKKAELASHSPRRIPKFIKTDRWTIESSSQRSSQSTSKNKLPFTTRNHHPSNGNTPRSNLINIVDHNSSFKASIIELNHSYDSYKQKSSYKVKSRLFSKNKLQSIKKTLEFVDVQIKQKANVYNGMKLPSLAKCLRERNWIQITSQVSQATFLWVDDPGFLEFQKLRMQQIKRGKLPIQSQSYLINHLPLDSSQLLWQITKICLGRHTPKIGEIIQDQKTINYKLIVSALQRWEEVKYWIIKPLDRSNFQNSRISFSKDQIKQQFKMMAKTPSLKGSYIVQQYISNPVLYNSRKFSLKSYLLITSIDHKMKGYLYDELLIQTSSLEYREDSKNLCVHFTGNDIQRHGKHYGRYEENNNISEQQLTHHFQNQKGKEKKIDFKADIREISIDLSEVIINKIANHYDYLGYFQLFQLDFLINDDFKAILISIDQSPDLGKKHKTKYTDKLVEDILKQLLLQLDSLWMYKSRLRFLTLPNITVDTMSTILKLSMIAGLIRVKEQQRRSESLSDQFQEISCVFQNDQYQSLSLSANLQDIFSRLLKKQSSEAFKKKIFFSLMTVQFINFWISKCPSILSYSFNHFVSIMIQHQQQKQPELILPVMNDHPLSITKKILSGFASQYFVATIIMLFSLKSNVVIQFICQTLRIGIYPAVVILVLTVRALKMNIGGNYKLVNFGLYLLMTAALTWSIVYLCSFYKIEEVLQFAAMLFASSFGLCVYSNAANSDFSDNFDAYGGIFAITSGISLTICFMSLLYASFSMFLFLTIAFSLAINFILMKITFVLISNYPQPELTSVFRLTGLLYWSLPQTISYEIAKICKRNH